MNVTNFTCLFTGLLSRDSCLWRSKFTSEGPESTEALLSLLLVFKDNLEWWKCPWHHLIDKTPVALDSSPLLVSSEMRTFGWTSREAGQAWSEHAHMARCLLSAWAGSVFIQPSREETWPGKTESRNSLLMTLSPLPFHSKGLLCGFPDPARPLTNTFFFLLDFVCQTKGKLFRILSYMS